MSRPCLIGWQKTSSVKTCVGVRIACLVFIAIACFVPYRQTRGADVSFEFTATEKDFSLYFPAYLANGFFTTTTSLRGTDATSSYMVALMDYTPGDVSRPADIPSWAEIDYFDGTSWLNQSPVTASGFQDYWQTLNMFDGRLETHYTWVDGSRNTRLEVNTFVSEDAPHLAATTLTLIPNFDGTVRLRFTLRPHPAPRYRLQMAHLNSVELEKAVAAAKAKLVLTDPTAPPRAPGETPASPVGQALLLPIGRRSGTRAKFRFRTLVATLGAVCFGSQDAVLTDSRLRRLVPSRYLRG